MNKLDLIETLKTEAGLTKKEAAAVVNIFFDEMTNALANDGRVAGDCVHFISRNIDPTLVGIQRAGNRSKFSLKNSRFLNAGKN